MDFFFFRVYNPTNTRFIENATPTLNYSLVFFYFFTFLQSTRKVFRNVLLFHFIIIYRSFIVYRDFSSVYYIYIVFFLFFLFNTYTILFTYTSVHAQADIKYRTTFSSQIL